MDDFDANSCLKINTGAPVPLHADCIMQVEDTELVAKHSDGTELSVRIQGTPSVDLDIRYTRLPFALLINFQLNFTDQSDAICKRANRCSAITPSSQAWLRTNRY